MEAIKAFSDFTLKEIKQNLRTERVYPNLLYLEAAENYTILYFKNGRTLISAYTLKAYQTILSEHSDFKRIHRSILVNMKHVSKLEVDKKHVRLSTGHKLKVSRRKLCEIE